MNKLDNYSKEKLTINALWVNVFSLLVLILAIIIFGIPFYFLWRNEINIESIINDFYSSFIWVSLAALVIGIIVHELIHGLIFALFAKNGFRSIKFGVLWKALALYCHCREPLIVKQYMVAVIAPAIILGFIPTIVAFFIGNIWLLIFGIIFIATASGDFLIVSLLKKENPNDFVEDHPSEMGCIIYRK